MHPPGSSVIAVLNVTNNPVHKPYTYIHKPERKLEPVFVNESLTVM